MKLSILCIVVMFSFSAVFAQQVVTIQPVAAKLNETVSVKYNPSAQGAVHTQASSMYAVMLMINTDNPPSIREQKMKNSNGVWTAEVMVDDPKAVGVVIRFETDEAIDDNQGSGWNLMISGKNGKPVMGAEFMQAVMQLQRNYYFVKHQPDTLKALAHLRQELAAFSKHWKAKKMFWILENKIAQGEKTNKRIVKELAAAYSTVKDNEEAVRELLPVFYMTGQEEKAGTIESAWLKKNPNGLIAELKAQQEFMNEKDQTRRAALAAEYVNRFTIQRGMEPIFLSAFLRVKDYQQAVMFLTKYPNVASNYYNSVGYGLISKGEQLELGVSIAKKGLDRMPSGDVRNSIEGYSQSRKSLMENRAYTRGTIADTYGEGLMKLGKYAEAEPVMEESNILMQQEDPDNNARLAECYSKNGKHEKVTALSFASLVNGRGSAQLLELYKTSYTALNGSAAGFDSVVNAAKTQMKNNLRAKLQKEKLDQPSIDFELTYLDGSPAKSSDLKGKVIVLDFWATWCGPCISSFPALQRVYDRYKLNPDVKILAMNTWERVTSAEREQHVKNFIEKNKYTFPVVFDTDLVKQYGVQGIPTKIIIDKEGIVRFKDVGFGGSEEMEQKMELQFEMLLGSGTASK